MEVAIIDKLVLQLFIRSSDGVLFEVDVIAGIDVVPQGDYRVLPLFLFFFPPFLLYSLLLFLLQFYFQGLQVAFKDLAVTALVELKLVVNALVHELVISAFLRKVVHCLQRNLHPHLLRRH